MSLGRKHIFVFSLLLGLGLTFQNCNKVRFSQVDLGSNSGQSLDLSAVSFLKISMNDQTQFDATPGAKYSLKVEASPDILADGLDSSATRLVKVAGSCAVTNLLPWTQSVNTSFQTDVVPALVNDGLPSSWTVLDSQVVAAGIDAYTIDPNTLPVPVENYVDLSSISMANQQIAPQKVNAAAMKLQQAISTTGSATLASDVITIGDNTLDYAAPVADSIGGCEWLGCVKSKSGLEACVKINAQKAVAAAPVPPVVPPPVVSCPAGQNLVAGICEKVTCPNGVGVELNNGIYACSCTDLGGENLTGGGCRFHNPGNFTFVVPPGISQIKVTAIGGGGGASSRDNNKWSGAHGAGGGAAIKSYFVRTGDQYTLVVGAGGKTSWWGADGRPGTDSIFNHSSGSITGKGGGVATNWKRAFRGPIIPTVAKAGTGLGGDINCAGGDGGFCLNGEFNCAAKNAPLCDGKAGGKSLTPSYGYGGGGGASEFGGDGIYSPTQFAASCGGGGGTLNSAALDQSGADGCVVVSWIP